LRRNESVEGGVVRSYDPGLLPEAGQPGLDECRSCFKGLTAPSDPRGPESLFFGYIDVNAALRSYGFMGRDRQRNRGPSR
jgi:hypothetical protein